MRLVADQSKWCLKIGYHKPIFSCCFFSCRFIWSVRLFLHYILDNVDGHEKGADI